MESYRTPDGDTIRIARGDLTGRGPAELVTGWIDGQIVTARAGDLRRASGDYAV